VRVKLIDITTVVHATEDKSRVVKALQNIIPEDLRSNIKVRESTLKGYYGNPITRLNVTFDREDADKVLNWIFNLLSDVDKLTLIDSFRLRFESGKLYLRFDKQKAYLGKLQLSEGDDVLRVIVYFSGRDASKASKVLEYLKTRGLI